MGFGMMLYLMYVFVISVWNAFAGGVRMSSRKTWDKVVGVTAVVAGILGMTYGFSLLLGVFPLFAAYLIIAPLVGLGLIIVVDSWYIYKETKSIWVLVIAIYNTVVTFWNIILMIKLLKDVKWEDIVKIGGGGAVAFGLSNVMGLLVSAIVSLIIGIIIAWMGHKLFSDGEAELRKVPSGFKA